MASSRRERGVSTARELRHRGRCPAWEVRHSCVGGVSQLRGRGEGGASSLRERGISTVQELRHRSVRGASARSGIDLMTAE